MFMLNKDTEKIPVVMLTAEENTESVDMAHRAGANDYIVKPLRLATLLAKIGKFLAKN